MRALAVLPTYNEADNLPKLIPLLLAVDPPLDVLVVDDASPDGTAEVAERTADGDPRVHVLRRTPPKGFAGSCIDGLRWTAEHGYDVGVLMDADLSHDPAVIPGMLELAEQGADLVIGSRYVPGGGLDVPEWGPFRMAVSRTGSGYARFMIGTPVRDCTSGFRCYSRSIIERVHLEDFASNGYAFQIEMLQRITKLGARVEEVPIVYVDRRAGQSKISNGIVAEALMRTTGIGVARLFGR